MDKKKILLDLINVHRQNHRRICYPILLIFTSLTLISIGGFIYFLYKYVTPMPHFNSQSYRIPSYITCTIASIFLFTLCICLYVLSSCNRDLKILSNENELLVWRLDNDQWISYLEYSYGPNRTYKGFSCLPWSCRQQKFNQLKTRGYGHIIFIRNGILIDELEFFRFEKKTLLRLEPIVPLNQQIILRFHFLYLRLIKQEITIKSEDIQRASTHADIFVPNVFYQPIERLNQMVYLFNAPPLIERYLNPNFQQIQSLFS